MPNCSAPGCKGNYTPEEHVPVFKLPEGPPEIRHAWIRALHREDIASLKNVYVCSKHFLKEDIELYHTVPKGDGTFYEVPRGRPKLKPTAIPSLLPGCPSYYSSTVSAGVKRTRLSLDCKEQDFLNQAINLSLKSENIELERFSVGCIQEIKDKLSLITLPTDCLVWFSTDNCMRLFLPKMDDHKISVDVSLEINSYLSVNGYLYGQVSSLSHNSITDIRQIETLFSEITHKLNSFPNERYPHHISKAKEHIDEAIYDLLDSDECESNHSDVVPRLQFILGQLENADLPKKRRRYNVITQILALKTHLISPSCYNYLQSSECISLPHVHTLEKLYSSFGLENDFSTFLSQVTSSFSPQEKNVIIQMDEVHVKSDISYKGGRIFGPNLSPDNPTKTVFAIMVSSLHKKWSCIARLIPCASINAGFIFPIVRSCILDIESCDLKVHIISTDNYPLNVSLFKQFSPNTQLETHVPHPSCDQRKLFFIFDFVHILKSVRNNWLNQKDFHRTFHFPNFQNFQLSSYEDHIQVLSASFSNVRLLYNSEKQSLAKLAPTLTIKACFPSIIERQNVKLVLKVVNELTIAALKLQNELRDPESRNNTHEFVDILLKIWKIFNINTPFKGQRLNDDFSRPLIFQDERFSFLACVVSWLEAWQALPGDKGKLSKQTFTSIKHSCTVLPEITNYLSEYCGFKYLLSSFLQTDPLEHHFGLYRMMSGSNYHVTYLQILETERRLKLSNILKIFASQQDSGLYSLQSFIDSYSTPSDSCNDSEIDVQLVMEEIGDLTSIECSCQILQSLAFIAGYSVHKYLKNTQPCHVCIDFLSIDKDFLFDEESQPELTLIRLTDRGGLKYPSEFILDSITTLWKILIAIERNVKLMEMFMQGSSRKFLVQLTLIFLEDTGMIGDSSCVSCGIYLLTILKKIIFTSSNCLLANKIKNYNSALISKGIEKRKLKKFSH